MFYFNTVIGYNGSLKNSNKTDNTQIRRCYTDRQDRGIFKYSLPYNIKAMTDKKKNIYLIKIENNVNFYDILNAYQINIFIT